MCITPLMDLYITSITKVRENDRLCLYEKKNRPTMLSFKYNHKNKSQGSLR